MALDVIALSKAKKYTDTSIEGTAGVIAGKNCTIDSIVDVDGGHRVTFKWTADNGNVRTSTMDVMDGADGQGERGEKGDKGDKGDTGDVKINEVVCTKAEIWAMPAGTYIWKLSQDEAIRVVTQQGTYVYNLKAGYRHLVIKLSASLGYYMQLGANENAPDSSQEMWSYWQNGEDFYYPQGIYRRFPIPDVFRNEVFTRRVERYSPSSIGDIWNIAASTEKYEILCLEMEASITSTNGIEFPIGTRLFFLRHMSEDETAFETPIVGFAYHSDGTLYSLTTFEDIDWYDKGYEEPFVLFAYPCRVDASSAFTASELTGMDNLDDIRTAGWYSWIENETPSSAPNTDESALNVIELANGNVMQVCYLNDDNIPVIFRRFYDATQETWGNWIAPAPNS